jgi:hypothetical protein
LSYGHRARSGFYQRVKASALRRRPRLGSSFVSKAGADGHHGSDMKCPVCSSKRVIILVHSLRALCSACMWQWAPPDEHPDVLTAADSAAALRQIRTEDGQLPES